MSQAEQISAFCSALLGSSDGQTGDDRLSGLMAYVWTIDHHRRKTTRWSPADQPGAIASIVREQAAEQPGQIAHVYVSTGLVPVEVAREKGAHGRATNDTVAGILALHCDIDIAGPGHQSKEYPPDVDAARRVVDAVGAVPTLVVHTGHGLHVWWMLDEPWLIADASNPDAEREQMYRLALEWSATLRCHADRLGGWKVDSTFDLARVMRVPGTWNCKPDSEPLPVMITEHNPGARYSPDDLRAYLLDDEVLAAYSRKRITGQLGVTVSELPGVDLSEVWARVNSSAYRNVDHEPDWLSGLLSLMPGSPLEATWYGNRTGLDDPSPSGVDAALVRLLANTGRVSVEQMAEAVMCRRLRTREKIDKVDPHKRTDYLVRTVARIAASAHDYDQRRDLEDQQRAARLAAAQEVAASARLSSVPDDPAPGDDGYPVADDDSDGADFADYTDYLINDRDRLPPAETPAGQAAALAQVKREHDAPAERERSAALPRPNSHEKPRGDSGDSRNQSNGNPEPPRELPGDVDPVWGERHGEAVKALVLLSDLLIPEIYRNNGIEVWKLEAKDFGENQRGRVCLRFPPAFDWPGGNRPATYRPGQPFFCDWYRRDGFDTPKAFRNSLIRDAKIMANPVAGRKDDWEEALNLLVPHWQRDSSGSDIVAQVHEWLLDYLTTYTPVLSEVEAVELHRAFLVDHRNWGTGGAPEMHLHVMSFMDYMAHQPGGLVGRGARTLLSYVDLTEHRPRWAGKDGQARRRSGWAQVGTGEFTRDEWALVLDSTRERMEQNQRRIAAVPDIPSGRRASGQ